MNYTYLANLAQDVRIPEKGIHSQTLYTDAHVNVVLFGFAAGEELSEHTASMPAILHIIEGECDLTLGEDAKTAQSGAWVHMQPNLPHSIKAKKPLIMLLILIKSGKS